MIKLDENTVLTGSEDGYLRGVSIYPNQIINILGNHSEDDEHFPIQKISLSHCKNFVASCSHDNSIKFYEISKFVKKRQNLNRDDFLDLENLKFEDEDKIKSSRQSKQKKVMDIEEEKGNEEEDFEDDDEHFDSEEEDIEEEIQIEKSKKNYKTKNMKTRNKEINNQKKMEFFSDL